MQNNNEKLTEVLNDLIKINNDRVAGYEKAIESTEGIDVDLKAVFHKMAEDSRKYASVLKSEVMKLGGEAETEGTTNSGKIYRVWMDIKATFTGKDRLAVLENCEYGEDAAQKAYTDALASDAEIPADIRQTITDQKSSLRTAHDLIKKYRDMQRAVKA
jgi:uncharacterized protein (TIGR02284 family)